MPQQIELNAVVATAQLGQRLDRVLAELFPDYSRSRLKSWILDGYVSLNGQIAIIPREKVFGGETLTICAQVEETRGWVPEALTLNIIYEDDDIIVINKPSNFVVHPGAGNQTGTVLNALLHHCPSLNDVPRAGIVHRLDKDTTGLMVIAKTLPAQTRLVSAISRREITREYEAVVNGLLMAGGTVDAPMARHSTKRTHMAVYPLGKPAVTHYRVMERFRAHTRLRLRLETGRTHQIRVHMAHIHHPITGDPTYGTRARYPKGVTVEAEEILRQFNRQALHATLLKLNHPITGKEMTWTAPLPDDMRSLIDCLKRDKYAEIEQESRR